MSCGENTLLITDIDGTLRGNKDDGIDPTIEDALIRKPELCITIATGRRYNQVAKMFTPSQLDLIFPVNTQYDTNIAIVDGGGTLVYRDGTPYFSFPLGNGVFNSLGDMIYELDKTEQI